MAAAVNKRSSHANSLLNATIFQKMPAKRVLFYVVERNQLFCMLPRRLAEAAILSLHVQDISSHVYATLC